MPVAIPVTIPKPETVATAVLLLLHIPPAVASLRAIVAPAHTVVGPVIADGKGFTVTTVVMLQPVPNI